MAFRNGQMTYMGRCGQVAARHPSGVLVGPSELRLDGKYYRNDGVDLTSGRKAEGTTAVSGSLKAAPVFHRTTPCYNAYGGGVDLAGVPV